MTPKFPISKKQHYKGYVFLLSIHEGNAFWSAHKYDGDPRVHINDLIRKFGKDHDLQIQGLILQAEREEAAEFKEPTVLDLTNEQQQ